MIKATRENPYQKHPIDVCNIGDRCSIALRRLGWRGYGKAFSRVNQYGETEQVKIREDRLVDYRPDKNEAWETMSWAVFAEYIVFNSYRNN